MAARTPRINNAPPVLPGDARGRSGRARLLVATGTVALMFGVPAHPVPAACLPADPAPGATVTCSGTISDPLNTQSTADLEISTTADAVFETPIDEIAVQTGSGTTVMNRGSIRNPDGSGSSSSGGGIRLGAGSTAINEGTITGDDRFNVRFGANDGTLINRGLLEQTGGRAVLASASVTGSRIVNETDGVITTPSNVITFSLGETEIINHGLIDNPGGIAIFALRRVDLHNTGVLRGMMILPEDSVVENVSGGEIVGDVVFRDGDNTFVWGAGSTVDGTVDGDDGSNTLILTGPGSDEFSDANFENFERLHVNDGRWTFDEAPDGYDEFAFHGGTIVAPLSAFPGDLTLGGTLEFLMDGDGVHDATLDGPGGLGVSGDGTLTLSGTYLYGGATEIIGAGLTLGDGVDLPSGTRLELDDGTLTLNDRPLTVSGLDGTGAVTMDGGSLIISDSDGPASFEGSIDGTGAILIGTGGLQHFQGPITAGPVTIDAGELTAGSNEALGAAGEALTIDTDGRLVLADALTIDRDLVIGSGGGSIRLDGHALDLAETVTGGGGLAIEGDGTATLTASLTVDGGLDLLDGAGLVTAPDWLLSSLSVSDDASLDLVLDLHPGADPLIEQGLPEDLAGTGDLVIRGDGTLAIDTPTSFSGAIEVRSGTLRLDETLAGPITVGTDGRLTGRGTLEDRLIVSGSLMPTGAGIVVNGPVTLADGARFEVTVDEPTSLALLRLLGSGGDLSIADAQLHVAGGYVHDGTSDVSIPLIEVDGSISGTFSSASGPVLDDDHEIAYEPDGVWLLFFQDPDDEPEESDDTGGEDGTDTGGGNDADSGDETDAGDGGETGSDNTPSVNGSLKARARSNNQQAVAERIEALNDLNPVPIGYLADMIRSLDDDAARQALADLSGDVHVSALSVEAPPVFTGSGSIGLGPFGSITNRTAAAPAAATEPNRWTGATGVPGGNLTQPGKGGTVPAAGHGAASADPFRINLAARGLSADGLPRSGFSLSGIGQHVDRRATSEARGFQATTAGTRLAFDQRLSDRALITASVILAETEITFGNSAEATHRHSGGGLRLTLDHDPLLFSIAADATHTRKSSARTIAIGSYSEQVTGRSERLTAGLEAAIARPFDLHHDETTGTANRTTLTPWASARAERRWHGGMEESGGYLTGLTTPSYTQTLLSGRAGLDLTHQRKLDDGSRVTLSGTASVTGTIGDTAPTVDLAFTQDPDGTAFRVTGLDQPRVNADLAAGITFENAEGALFGLGYQHTAGRGLSSHAVMARFGWRW